MCNRSSCSPYALPMVSQCELSNCRCTCNHQSHDRSKERSCCCAQLQLYWPAGLQLKLYHLGLHGVDCTFQRLPCSSACLVPCFSPHKLASTLRFATLSQGLRGFSQTGMMKHIMFGTKMCISTPAHVHFNPHRFNQCHRLFLPCLGSCSPRRLSWCSNQG